MINRSIINLSSSTTYLKNVEVMMLIESQYDRY